MRKAQNRNPVEGIKSKAFEAAKATVQCRWKVQVLKEMFDAMSDQDPIQFDDHVSCFQGVVTICSDIIDQLVAVESAIGKAREQAELCSPDPEKMRNREEEQEKMREDLQSMGIDPAAKRGLKPPVTVEEMLEEEGHDLF